MEVLLAKMTSSKDAATRYECMKALNTGLQEFERTAALSLNMVAGSWHAENTERGFERLRSQRNLGELIFGYFGHFGYFVFLGYFGYFGYRIRMGN